MCDPSAADVSLYGDRGCYAECGVCARVLASEAHYFVVTYPRGTRVASGCSVDVRAGRHVPQLSKHRFFPEMETDECDIDNRFGQ